MKKMVLVVILGMFSLIASASPRIVLEDNATNYQQTDSGYILQFKLVALQSEYLSIMDEVQNLADRLSMQVSEGSNGTYDCVFTVNHQNHPEYVHKMLVSIGISELEHKGTVQSIDQIIGILYSYL